MVNQSFIDVCASFISGGQPPDPRCGVPCRAAAIKTLCALCDSASLR